MPESLQRKNMQQLAGFSAVIPQLMAQWHVPGIALAIVQHGRLLFSEGFGYCSLSTEQEVNSQTLFPIGSCTKTFTASMMSILVDQGQLDWDRPVQTYVPDLQLADPVLTTRITPRDLAAHCTGLPRHDFFWYRSSLNRQEMFERLRWLEPVQAPYPTFQYSNLSYLIAGYLIACITGQTWEACIEQQLFAPLALASSYSSLESVRDEQNCARPHREIEHIVQEIPYYRHWEGIAPAGAVVSCIADLSKWVAFQLQEGDPQAERILSARQRSEMHTPYIRLSTPAPYPELSSASYGLGWMIRTYRGHTVLQHGGCIDGFSSLITLLPQVNAGYVILANVEDTSLAQILALSLCDIFLDLPAIPWDTRWRAEKDSREAQAQRLRRQEALSSRPVPVQTFPLAIYTGTYHHPGYGDLFITAQKQQLFLTFREMTFPLTSYPNHRFEVNLFGHKMPATFFTGVDDSISSLTLPLEPCVRNIRFQRLINEPGAGTCCITAS